MEKKTYYHLTESTLSDYFRTILRHSHILLICTFVIVAITYFGLKLETPMYESSVKMLISAEKQVATSYYKELESFDDLARSLTQSEIVKSDQVIERVAKQFESSIYPLDYEKKFCSPLKAFFIDREAKKIKKGLKDLSLAQKQEILYRKAIQKLKKNIKVEPIQETSLFTITARDFSADEAAKIANLISRSYVIFDLEQQLLELQIKYGDKHPRIRQLSDNIDNISRNLAMVSLPALEAMGPGSVKIIEQAKPSLSPKATNRRLSLILALIVSLFLGTLLAFIFEYFDQTFRSLKDVNQSFSQPFLGFVFKNGIFNNKIIRGVKSKYSYVTSYQRLADKIYMQLKAEDHHSLLMTSSLPKEDVDITIANLGIILAHKFPKDVLVVDANYRNPSMHRIFRASRRRGLADILERKAKIADVICVKKNGLSVITTGKAVRDPISLLDSQEMEDFLTEAKEKFKFILVHCSGLNEYHDSAILAPHVDATVLQVNEGFTPRQLAKDSMAILEEAKSNILGVILNNRSLSLLKLIYEQNYRFVAMMFILAIAMFFILDYALSEVFSDVRAIKFIRETFFQTLYNHFKVMK